MADEIEDLLHRRSDLSTFLVHLTRDGKKKSAYERLLTMLVDKCIEARSVFGMASDWADQDEAVADTQRCVCFTEVPLEQVWMVTREITLRQVHLRPYGLAFMKGYGRKRGANPVWYLDITPTHNWLTNPINVLVEIALRGEAYSIDSTPPAVNGALIQGPPPHENPILKLTPFMEQMGTRPGYYKKEFWWEREWRMVGDFNFLSYNNVVAVFVPEAEHDQFHGDLAIALDKDVEWVERRLPLLDAQWGLERMIARLAGVEDQDAGPFPGA